MKSMGHLLPLIDSGRLIRPFTGRYLAPLSTCPSGLAALGTEDEEIAEDIKNVLYTDSAVAGEAAGIGMGLLLAGSASEKAQEMLAYAHDTQHEKIIRGEPRAERTDDMMVWFVFISAAPFSSVLLL